MSQSEPDRAFNKVCLKNNFEMLLKTSTKINFPKTFPEINNDLKL